MANPSPTITFEVDLTLHMNEDFGPIMSQKSVGMDSPDPANLSTAPDRLSTFLPGVFLGNKAVKHGDQFTVYGSEAVYLRKMYAQGYAPADRAYLKVV